MINFGDVIKDETKERNPNWPEIPDHPYKILLMGVSGLRKKIIISSKKSAIRYLLNLFIH